MHYDRRLEAQDNITTSDTSSSDYDTTQHFRHPGPKRQRNLPSESDQYFTAKSNGSSSDESEWSPKQKKVTTSQVSLASLPVSTPTRPVVVNENKLPVLHPEMAAKLLEPENTETISQMTASKACGVALKHPATCHLPVVYYSDSEQSGNLDHTCPQESQSLFQATETAWEIGDWQLIGSEPAAIQRIKFASPIAFNAFRVSDRELELHIYNADS